MDVTRERAEQQWLLRRAERSIDSATLAAIGSWLDAFRLALLQELGVPQALVAAAGDMDPASAHIDYSIEAAVARSWGEWQNQLENQVLPTVSIAFGEAFQQTRRADPQGAFRHQQQYLAEVSDRLKIWPQGAFEDIRPELLEALSEAETVYQMTDRIGRVLTIDAKSRELRAQINEVEERLASPDLDPADRAELRAWRKDLWEQHDESLNEWQWKARRIARTESHGAVSAGQLAAAKEREQLTGIRMWKRWLSVAGDNRTRASHRVADGQTVPLDQPFRVGGFLLDHPADAISVAPHEVINCFVADTEVVAPGAQASIRTPYEGALVTLTMQSGGVLSASPNHPVLTERGWVRIGDLNKGDKLFKTAIRDSERIRSDPNEQSVPTTLGELHSSASDSGEIQRVASSVVNFYGDRPSGEVDVVSIDRELRNRLDAAHRESFRKSGLMWRGPLATPLPVTRPGFDFSVRSGDTTNSGVSRICEPGTLVGASLAHSGKHGVGSITGHDTGLNQDATDNGPRHGLAYADRLFRLAGEISTNDRLGIEHDATLRCSISKATHRLAGFNESSPDHLPVHPDCGTYLSGALARPVHGARSVDIDGDASVARRMAGKDHDSVVGENSTHGLVGYAKSSGYLADADAVAVEVARKFGVEGDSVRGGCATSTQGNFRGDESVPDTLPGYAERLSDAGRALAGFVELDDVVNVEVSTFSGHLFTVQSGSGMYLANGYTSRNCRCSMMIYDDDELQDEFDEQGGKGPVEPGAVRIGPDDPERADEAIVQVAEREGRVKPKVGQRGEDAGQSMPAEPVDVEITDERTPIPAPDVETATEERLADYLIRTDEREDDELRALVEEELARRRDSDEIEVQFGEPEHADDVLEVDDDGDWLDDPRWASDDDEDLPPVTDDDEPYWDDWQVDDDDLPGDVVPADPPEIVENIGSQDLDAVQAEFDRVQDEFADACESGDEARITEALARLDEAEGRLNEATQAAEVDDDGFRDSDGAGTYSEVEPDDDPLEDLADSYDPDDPD